MRKVIDYVKENKKIIIVTILVALLIGAIYFINNSTSTKNTSSTEESYSETELKLINILSNIQGVGATNVLINQSEDNILGVVIVCEGANNIMVKNDILNAVSTALNIQKDIIAIYSMTV
jgi:uncharacterized protein YpmB